MHEPIAFIAPFENLAKQAEAIIRSEGYPARVYRGDLGQGVTAAAAALDAGARVIVSRGGTAKRIRAELARRLVMDVIEVEASVYNVIRYLHENFRVDLRVAVVGFPQFTAMGRAVCESMEIIHRVFEIGQEDDAVPAVNALMGWRADAVLGDTISCRLMADLGWKSHHLIESSRHSIQDALERAKLLLGTLDRQLAHNRKLGTVLACALQGVAIITADGVVEDMNGRCRDLLGATDTVGQPLAAILPEAGQSGDEPGQILCDRNGEQLVVDFVPFAAEPPGDPGGMVMTVQPARRIQETENAIRTRLRNKGFFARHRLSDIIHASPEMAAAVGIAADYARSEANIVITGETGTGKEVFAQGIHNASHRAGGMFVAVNCAALPASLLESELFGYSPGAFTGALRGGKPGLFELAHRGTLFLDEVAEMDPYMQTRLLRAIQERQIMRLGDSRIIPVDVRIIAAANRNLEEEVERGGLRLDLFFRLQVLSLEIPPLRDRGEDAVLLLEHYLAKHAARMRVPLRRPDESFFAAVRRYPWPGNVRELENLAERYVVLQHRQPEWHTLLPHLDRKRPDTTVITKPEAPPAGETLDDVIRRTIHQALAEERGNIQRASRRLGVNRNTVKRWLREGKDGE
ncbi:MAG: sigma 54-interacting transcriptional regulator [Planctomycetes bacterium]|nr:sigma 54-interacting transcriptional regulator [Planctomycetota bacterium]